MKHEMNLQLFAGGHSVTVLKDGHMTTASASSTSDVQANATVTLTLTPASNYELDTVEVLAGGVTIEYGDDVTFKMGSADVTLIARAKKANTYQVLENRDVWVNGSKTTLRRNTTLVKAPNGAIKAVDVTGTTVSLNSEMVADLVKEGVIVKI
jgi:hypothetical protein